MACNNPLTAWATGDGITFDRRERDIRKEILLPCGQCRGCRLERSRQWATRCMHEAQMHEHNCFVTLTYAPEHLPRNCSLDYRDWQLFMKRLRKARTRSLRSLQAASPPLLGKEEIRFYMCGEYGDDLARPHFHAILFGIDFADKKLISTKRGNNLYTNPTLDKIWAKGHAWIGSATWQSAAYVARYVMKKITGEQAKTHYLTIDEQTGETTERKPEFNNMSRRPGIGSSWLNKYQSDVYPHGKVVINGTQAPAPRYYDKLHQRENKKLHEELKAQREQEAYKSRDQRNDQRRQAREKILEAKTKYLKRPLRG